MSTAPTTLTQASLSAPLQVLMLQLFSLVARNITETERQATVLDQLQETLLERFEKQDRKLEELSTQLQACNDITVRKLEEVLSKQSDACSQDEGQLNKTLATDRQTRLLKVDKEETNKTLENEQLKLEMWGRRYEEGAAYLRAHPGSDAAGLLRAAAAGAAGAVLLLAGVGVDVDARGEAHQTALHVAASRGHVGTVQILAEADADLDAEDASGATPLHLAAEADHEGACRALLAAGVPVDVRTAGGWTALHRAAEAGRAAVCVLLLDSGAPVDDLGGAHDTPLHLAAQNGHKDVVQLLLSRGADRALTNSFGRSALEEARFWKHLDVAGMLSRS